MSHGIQIKHMPQSKPTSARHRREYTAPSQPARSLFVDVPFHPAMVDENIDDIIAIMLDFDDSSKKDQNAAPLVVHCTFRPDMITRNNAISIRELDGEGTPEEVKNILG